MAMNQQEARNNQLAESAKFLNTGLHNPPGMYQIEKVWGWIEAVIVTLGCATWAGSKKAALLITEGAELLEGLREMSHGDGCRRLIHAEMGENVAGAVSPSQL